MPAHLLRGLALVGLSLWLPLATAAQSRGRAELEPLVERARERGDRGASQLFFELASGRDAAAFAALRDALEFVEDQSLARAAFGAAALFKGTSLEGTVVDWLGNQAFRSPRSTHQLAAAAALAYFWKDHEGALMRVLENHPTRACRSAVLVPLQAGLVAKGSVAACKLVFENAALEDRSDELALTAALTAFSSRSTRSYLAGQLRLQSLDTQRKLILLRHFALSEEPEVLQAIEKRLGDPIDAVRLRAMELLANQRDGSTLARLERIAKLGDEAFVVRAIETLATKREADSAWIEELYSFTHDQSDAVRLGAVRALGRLQTQDALTLLHRLLSDEDRTVRLSALEEIGAKRQLRSIPRLIEALAVADGVQAEEIARWLRLFTGEDHGSSAARWRAWFEDQGGALQLPTLAEAQRLENERLVRRNAIGELRTASFYGLRIESDHVTFVIDLSGSMEDPAGGRTTSSSERGKTRLDVAKEELRNALRQLLNGVMFNIITFRSEVGAMHPKLVELGAQSRSSATEQLESWRASGGTALYDGLLRALRDPDSDTIYLLTDGEPTMGEVTDAAEIRRRIGELCRLKSVRIHGISIGRESELLRWLAKDSGGQYVEIL
jgi:HEAT repeat protein